MRFFSVLFLVACSYGLFGQTFQLANEYYVNGEYEKAAVMFKKLFDSQRGVSDTYFSRYLECLIKLDRFSEAIDVVEGNLKKNPTDLQNYVYLGNIYEKNGQVEKGESYYEKAIDKLYPDQLAISRLASSFQRLNKLEYAIKAYEKGEEIGGMKDVFAQHMANLYQRLGDQSKMIEYYLRSVSAGNSDVIRAQNHFSRYLEKDEFGELQAQLYMLIQEDPDALSYLELLEWVFIQQKDYSNALRQAKAIDNRSGTQGQRVYNLAMVASNARDYDAAIQAYDHIINSIGQISPYYLDAKKEKLNVLRNKVVRSQVYDESDLLALRNEYDTFIQDNGANANTADILSDWAELEALYLDNVDKAIELLNQIVKLASVDRFILNNAKLDLADYYLIKGEIWESTLLYSQVDKEFREDYLGEIARYKNARLSYYNGDFEWAQAQFDILKSATSRLISNDAIDQSVFIMDNLGLDTTAIPLQMYARAELLTFQNKYNEAFMTMDSIPLLYPGHKLEDDIWYLKARVYKRQKQWDKAIDRYQAVFETYPEEIRADNAIFELAGVYEILDQEDEAMALYEKLFIDYSGSILAVEARKKFRTLRGDVVQ